MANQLNFDFQLEQGADYTFHFSYGGRLQGIYPDKVSSAVAADSNFLTPSASVSSLGVLSSNDLAVHFVYNGDGSSIGDAGMEMLKVITDAANFGFGDMDLGVAGTLKFQSANDGYIPASQGTPRKAGDTELSSAVGISGLVLGGVLLLLVFLVILKVEL